MKTKKNTKYGHCAYNLDTREFLYSTSVNELKRRVAQSSRKNKTSRWIFANGKEEQAIEKLAYKSVQYI